MLGVGPDGHVASLFPGYPQLDVDRRHRGRRPRLPQAAAGPDQPHAPCLNRAARCGSSSAARTRPRRRPRPRRGHRRARRPPRGGGKAETIWFLDRAAAVAPQSTRRRELAATARAASSATDASVPVMAHRADHRPAVRRLGGPVLDSAELAAQKMMSPDLRRERSSWSASSRMSAGLLVGAALLHVGEVRLVGLDLGRRGRVVGVHAGREAALGAVPGVGDGGLDREGHHGAVPVGAEVGDRLPGRGLATLGLAHRASADPASPDRVSPTSHGLCSYGSSFSSGRPEEGPGR